MKSKKFAIRLVTTLACLAFATTLVAEDPKPLQVGDVAPDFELINREGKKEKLSSRFKKDGKPVILLFSRAHW